MLRKGFIGVLMVPVLLLAACGGGGGSGSGSGSSSTTCNQTGNAAPTATYAAILATAWGAIDPQSPTLSPALSSGCKATYTASNLPTGMAIDPSTGQVTGIPRTAATGTFTVKVSVAGYSDAISTVSYVVKPEVVFPDLAAPQANSLAAQNPATPEGIWYESETNTGGYTAIAADGTYASAKYTASSATMVFGSLATPLGATTWSLNSGGQEFIYLGSNINTANSINSIMSGLGSYTRKSNLSGTYSTNKETVALSKKYSFTNAFAINSLADMAGTYTRLSSTSSFRMVADNAGALSGSYTTGATSCPISGQLTLPVAGKNVMKISFKATCPSVTVSYSGLSFRSLKFSYAADGTTATGARYSMEFIVKNSTNDDTWNTELTRQ